jgi:hypothetical protein
MRYVRLYTADDGNAYFEDIDVPLKPRDAATELSDIFPVKAMVMRRNNSEYELDYHTAPRRQFIVNLTGTVENRGQRRRDTTVWAGQHHAGGGHHRQRPHQQSPYQRKAFAVPPP